MTTTNTSTKCTYNDTCGLRKDHVGPCRPIDPTTLEVRHPAVSELFIWLPEWLVVGGFFFGALIADGWLSFACLLVSVAVVVWIVGNRAVLRRRDERVLREYDADLAAADARLLEHGTDR